MESTNRYMGHFLSSGGTSTFLYTYEYNRHSVRNHVQHCFILSKLLSFYSFNISNESALFFSSQSLHVRVQEVEKPNEMILLFHF